MPVNESYLDNATNETSHSSDFLSEGNDTTYNGTFNNVTASGFHTCQVTKRCINGLILPLWIPDADGHPAAAFRAVIYFIALAYLLYGVSIITDRIVSATEVMAAHKRTVTAKLKSGETITVKTPVWHPVVASLTFDAIGTCSPEILLPLIEIIHNNFIPDMLGPSLITGSAAYHLFLITSICLLTVRESSGKPIKDLHLFFTTASFAILAFLWVYLCLDKISPNVIELWEALVTMMLFPVLVFSAWAMSCRYPEKIVSAVNRMFSRRVSPFVTRSPTNSSASNRSNDSDSAQPAQNKSRRRKLAARLKALKERFPSKSQTELEEIAKLEIIEETPRSSAYYRLHSGKETAETKRHADFIREELFHKSENLVQMVGFISQRSSCLESCGTTVVTVERWGAGVADTVLSVDYETAQGTAKANVNFVPTSGRLTFAPGQQHAEIPITILDDNIFEETAKFFLLKISRPAIGSSRTLLVPGRDSVHGLRVSRAELAINEMAVSILDDDHCGVFSFEKQDQPVPDNINVAKIKVVRSKGTKGRIAVPYRISPGTAKNQQDYIAEPEGVLRFNNGQFEGFIEIKIVDKDRFGEVYTFHIELLQPKKETPNEIKSTIGLPRLGNPNLIQIGICENEEMKEALDRLLKTPEIPGYVVSSTWKDQIRDAFVVYDDDGFEVSSFPVSAGGCFKRSHLIVAKAYVLHGTALPWKVAVAILPPARLLHGWIAYISLLALMAVVAALIGDCASHFACAVGLKDTVTAITLIPLGVGLPDTFASRRAAHHEKTADAAIGSITGANAVTVFLGMGLSWTVGALYQTANGRVLQMPTMNLGFSVMLYCTFASAGILVLLLRRLPPVRGELGGPLSIRIMSALFFILLWILFITLSILEDYCIILPFR